jgi:hypothetical protein
MVVALFGVDLKWTGWIARTLTTFVGNFKI